MNKKLLPQIFALFTFLFFNINVYSQNIAINASGTAANLSSMLDISSGTSSNKGLLIPRVTSAQKTAMNPLPAAAQGLIVYQTDGVEGFYYNTSTTTTPVWSYLTPGGWSLLGNTGTVSATNFIGTTDAVDWVVRTTNTERMRVLAGGNVGIGVTNSAYNLEINGTFGFGNGASGSYRSRTETRNDAGQIATQSGFFETSAPTNFPSGAASWWHLVDIRHSNNANNYALQIAGSFFDQNLYFRKTNNSSTTAWSQLLTTAAASTGYIQNQFAGAQASANHWVSGSSRATEVYAANWFRNDAANTGLYNSSTGAGIYSPSVGLMSTYNSASLQIEGASVGAGNLRFTTANPYIVSSSYFVAPGGAYFNVGTVYTEAQYQSRGGIHNDANTYLTVAGGTLAYTYFTGRIGILTTAPTVPVDAVGAGLFGNGTYRNKIGWYVGADPYVGGSVNGWGYCGSNTEAWWNVSSYNYAAPSRREIKHNITPVNESAELSELVMNDIDRIKPSFYKYNIETDQMEAGNETKYRAQMHLGVIIDESPDYILDQSFSGVDLYAISTLALAGVKYNRNEIKEIKELLGKVSVLTISDFGSMVLDGSEVLVRFSDEFISKFSSSDNMPSITVTPTNANASLYITEITKEGFKVKNGMNTNGSLTFNWIAMAKVNTPVANENKNSNEKISAELLQQIKVPANIKSSTNTYFMNLKPTQGKNLEENKQEPTNPNLVSPEIMRKPLQTRTETPTYPIEKTNTVTPK